MKPIYLFWAAVAAFAACAQVTYMTDAIRLTTGSYADPPFALADPWPTVRNPSEAAKAAGIAQGDKVVAIEGRTPRGDVELAEPVHRLGAGGILDVTIDRAGSVFEAHVRMGRSLLRPSWYYALIAWILMPGVSLALGLWVTGARPADPRAWLMFGVLLGMSQVTRIPALDSMGWGPVLGLPGTLLQSGGVAVWAACMLFFGVYFPHRWSLDRRFPWAKWALLLGPAYVLTQVTPASLAAALDDPLLAHLPGGHLSDGIFLACLCPSISVFFFAISHKYSDRTSSPDDRRRLKLLYWGCTAGLTPLFLMILVNLATGRAPFSGVPYAIALMCTAIFPLTMAYVVVVERALDVRVVLRQGVQYALARRGVRVLQGVVGTVVLIQAIGYAQSPGTSRPKQMILIAIGVAIVVRLRVAGQILSHWVDRRFFREAYNTEQILSELAEQVRGILDREDLLHTVARKISESLHVDRIAVFLREGGGFRPAFALGYAAPPALTIDARDGRLQELQESRTALLASRGSAMVLDAEVLLPLPSRKEVLGFLALGPKKSQEPYSTGDARLLQTVAVQTGMALENARLSEQIASEMAQRELLAREIEIAREVQERLFPQVLPEVPALEYAGHCRPARAVGGDYYDFLALASGRLGLVIGDVSGKGVPAALLMASLQASVRGQSQGVASVADLMGNVNRLVCDASPENRYATFFYAQFDPASRRLIYSNGGHNPPIVLRGEDVLRLEAGGPPVGLFRVSRYTQEEIVLEPGDVLVLFTDGVSEAENPEEEEWGEEALIAAARSCRALPPTEAIARIMQAADEFAGGAPQHDDMTLVVARVLESS